MSGENSSSSPSPGETSSSPLTWEITEDTLLLITWVLEGVLLPIVGAVGVLSNIASLMVILRVDLKLKPSFLRLVATLSIFDTLCIVLTMLLFSGPKIQETYRLQVFPLLVPVLLPLAHISLAGSLFTVLGLAIERVLSVRKPHLIISRCASLAGLAAIVLLALLANVTSFFEYTTKVQYITLQTGRPLLGALWISDNKITGQTKWSYIQVEPTALRVDALYIKVSCFASIVLSIVPFFVLITLNILIYQKIKQRSSLLAVTSEREKRQLFIASILILIIFIYAVCHSLQVLINIAKLFAVFTGADIWGSKLTLSASLSHLLISINCSSNFAIYCAKDKKFRDYFLQVISCGTLRVRLSSWRSRSSGMTLHEGSRGVTPTSFLLSPFNKARRRDSRTCSPVRL